MALSDSKFANNKTESSTLEPSSSTTQEIQEPKKKKRTRGRTRAQREAAAERRAATTIAVQNIFSTTLEPTSQTTPESQRSAPRLSVNASTFVPASKRDVPNKNHVKSDSAPEAATSGVSLPTRNSNLSADAQAFHPIGAPQAAPSLGSEKTSAPMPHNAFQHQLGQIPFRQHNHPVQVPQPLWLPNPNLSYTPPYTPSFYQSPTFVAPNPFAPMYNHGQLAPIPFRQEAVPPARIIPTTEPQRRITYSREPISISPSLPGGWIKRYDSGSSKYFYINIYTQKAQWEEPTAQAARPTTTSPVKAGGSTEGSKSGSEIALLPKGSKDEEIQSSTNIILAESIDKIDLLINASLDGHKYMRLGPEALVYLAISTTPTPHAIRACLNPNLEFPYERKPLPTDTSFVPNPVVSFLVDEQDHFVCQLCKETKMQLSEPRCKITDDKPVLMPCGHIAGSKCMAHWFSTGRDYCPFCQFSLRHAQCGHMRMPLTLDLESIFAVPPTVPGGGEFPRLCRNCNVKGLVIYEVVNMRRLKLAFLRARHAFDQDDSAENKAALDVALRCLEDLSFTSREKRLAHLYLLW